MSMQRCCPPAAVDPTDRTEDAAIFKALADTTGWRCSRRSRAPRTKSASATSRRAAAEAADRVAPPAGPARSRARDVRTARHLGLLSPRRRRTRAHRRRTRSSSHKEPPHEDAPQPRDARPRPSVAFYSTLLDARRKKLADYALFVTEQPGLELALDLDADAHAGPGQHFGIVVDRPTRSTRRSPGWRRPATRSTSSARDVLLREANESVGERSDGRRWETYVVHEESEARDDLLRRSCASARCVEPAAASSPSSSARRSCSPRSSARGSWRSACGGNAASRCWRTPSRPAARSSR